MKPTRSFLAFILLLLASLACSLFSSAPADQPAEPATAAPIQPSEPTQTPAPTAVPAPKLGEVILAENFADNSNNWYIGKDDTGENAIKDGKYNVRILIQDQFFWFDAPVSVSDVDVSVDTEFTEGAPENAAYGVLCHYKDGDNQYRAYVAPDGYFFLDKRVSGEHVLLADWTFSSAIQSGVGAVNALRFVCSEGRLTLYVNDTLLADVADSSLSGGSFAFVAGNYKNKKEDTHPIGVNFSNLVVRKPVVGQTPTGSLLSDTFDDNAKGWGVFDDLGKASAQVENGQMVMKIIEPESTYSVFPGVVLSDVDLSFDAVVQEGTPANASFGVTCRRVDADNRYLFDVSNDGHYTLNKSVKGQFSKIVDWAVSNAIKTNVGDVNHVRVVCSGKNLELYVNDQMLISSQDTDLTAGGFSLQSGRFKVDDKPVTVAFDNVEVLYPAK